MKREKTLKNFCHTSVEKYLKLMKCSGGVRKEMAKNRSMSKRTKSMRFRMAAKLYKAANNNNNNNYGGGKILLHFKIHKDFGEGELKLVFLFVRSEPGTRSWSWSPKPCFPWSQRQSSKFFHAPGLL